MSERKEILGSLGTGKSYHAKALGLSPEGVHDRFWQHLAAQPDNPRWTAETLRNVEAVRRAQNAKPDAP